MVKTMGVAALQLVEGEHGRGLVAVGHADRAARWSWPHDASSRRHRL